MTDPARKDPLEKEEIARLMSGANAQYRSSRTPGLSRMSGGEALAALIVFAVVGTILYIHLDVRPFLPFQLSEGTASWLTGLSLVAAGIGWMGLLFVGGTFLWGVIQVKFFPKQPKITCDDCGHRNLAKQYSENHMCAKCGGKSVYCGKCGLSSSIDNFLSGEGCTHCGHKSVALKY